jgi:hypothetical protein
VSVFVSRDRRQIIPPTIIHPQIVADPLGLDVILTQFSSTASNPRFILYCPENWGDEDRIRLNSWCLEAEKSSNISDCLLIQATLPQTEIIPPIRSQIFGTLSFRSFPRNNSRITIKPGSSPISLVDIAPTLLNMLHLLIPVEYIGKIIPLSHHKFRNLLPDRRERALYEHENGSKTLITAQYVMTIPFQGTNGELFDLIADSGFTNNLWDDRSHFDIKTALFLEFLWAQLDKEVMPMPRIAGA